MPQYRKKPVEIEARCFTTNNDDGTCCNELVAWIGGSSYTDQTGVYIPTLEGVMRADVGDYIIKVVNGEFYPCKPDIFEKTYEAV